MWTVTDINDKVVRNTHLGFSFIKSLDDRSVIVFLQNPAILSIKGCADVQCLHGQLIILGHILNEASDSQRVYSLDSEADLFFETVARPFNHNTPELDKLKIDFAIRNEVRAKRLEYDCIFVLRNCYDDLKEWDQFLRVRGYDLFPPATKSPLYHILHCELAQVAPTARKILKIPNDWPTIGERFSTNPNKKLVVCGQKGAGKSTFIRWMTNYLLRIHPFVIIIDTDPGQSEFSVPGCVSAIQVSSPLLGPNYTHFRETMRTIYVRSVDVTWAKEYYIPALENILDSTLSTLSKGSYQAPVIINTMGFVHGIGLEILNSVIVKAKASHVVLLRTNNQGETLNPNRLTKDVPYDLDVVDSVAKVKSNILGRNYTGFTKREICMLSYFPLYCLNDAEASEVPKIFDLDQVTFTPALVAPVEPTTILVLGKIENDHFFVYGFGLVHAHRKNVLYVWTPLKTEKAREVTHISRHCHMLKDYSSMMESNYWSGNFPQVQALTKKT